MKQPFSHIRIKCIEAEMYLMRHYAKMEANILQISEPDGIIVIWSPFQKQHIFTPILVSEC